MITHKCIALDSRTEWQEALRGIEHGFAHTWESCYAMHLTTRRNTYLYCFESGDVRIVCPLMEREFGGYIDIATPYGFSGFIGNEDCPEFPVHWNSFVKQKNYVCGYIGLNPLFENSTYFNPEQLYQSNVLYFLDLSLHEKQLFANLDRNRQRQLKNYENESHRLIHDKSLLCEFLIAHYADFMHKANASPASWLSQETLSFLCGLDNILIIGAGKTEVEAVYVFAYTTYSAECFINVSLPEGRGHTTTLLWYGVNHLKSLQVPCLNFGGGIREGDSIAQAKQRFGCQKLPFRCLKQIYEPEIYQQLCQRSHADSSDMTSYFPAYRKH